MVVYLIRRFLRVKTLDSASLSTPSSSPLSWLLSSVMLKTCGGFDGRVRGGHALYSHRMKQHLPLELNDIVITLRFDKERWAGIREKKGRV